MKLKQITLHNYRNFEQYTLNLGNVATILIGRNGMGKTNLLSGMVQVLSFIFSKQRNTPQYDFINSCSQGVKRFLASDPRFENKYIYPLSLKADAVLNGSTHPIHWEFYQESEKSGLRDSLFRDAYHSFWQYYHDKKEKPVFAYFSDSFPHKETKLSAKMNEKLNSGNPLPSNTGYYQWDYEQSCAGIWKIYFAQEWFNALSDPSKKEYVNAINEVLRRFSEPINDDANNELKISELFGKVINQKTVLMVKFEDGRETMFDLMPAGYVRMFSMVLDLANRSFLLNGNCNPEGVVFIDEIDLHLHPSLAAEVFPRMHRSFPRMQFIVSTHSPLVITNFNQSIGNEDDYRLFQLKKNDAGYYNERVYDIYGLDYNSGLTNYMSTPISVGHTDNLVKAYQYWKGEDETKAARIADMLISKYGKESQVIKMLNL